MFIPANHRHGRGSWPLPFQSRDWVDVYSGQGAKSCPKRLTSFNPATGLMFIPASEFRNDVTENPQFQSRDWVDVYSGMACRCHPSINRCFNPATGLMFIPARSDTPGYRERGFQSRDWVDVYSGDVTGTARASTSLFQSRDWVDVYSGIVIHRQRRGQVDGFNPATGLMFIPAWRCGLPCASRLFQSRDWVDVYSGRHSFLWKSASLQVSIPRLG